MKTQIMAWQTGPNRTSAATDKCQTRQVSETSVRDKRQGQGTGQESVLTIYTPSRRPFPGDFKLDWQQRPKGCLIYLRRTSERGTIKLLGHSWEIDPLWQHRLVRSEVDLQAGQIRFYRLRRREPGEQPLIKTVPYQLPLRRFDTRPRYHHPLTPIR